MATAAGVGSGALSGAAAGTAIMPGYGTAVGAVLGGVLGALQGDGGAGAQKQISQNELQNAINQEAYARGLNAEALRRAVAGSIDSQGSTIRYDPTSNSWVSNLGKAPSAQQGAINSAAILHNTVDVPQASQNNAASSITASLARRGLSGAINNLESYEPVTTGQMYGALQDSSTRANAAVQNPLVADTLRAFARSGTASGPVLAQLQRQSSDTLAKEMSDNTVKAMTSAADVNNTNRQALSTPINTLEAASVPHQQDTTPSFTPGPADSLSAQVGGRAANSATPASAGAGSSAYGTIAANQAANLASSTAMNSPVPGQIAGAFQSIQNLGKQGAFSGLGTKINDWFSGNAGGNNAASNYDTNSPTFNPYAGMTPTSNPVNFFNEFGYSNS